MGKLQQKNTISDGMDDTEFSEASTWKEPTAARREPESLTNTGYSDASSWNGQPISPAKLGGALASPDNMSVRSWSSTSSKRFTKTLALSPDNSYFLPKCFKEEFLQIIEEQM